MPYIKTGFLKIWVSFFLEFGVFTDFCHQTDWPVCPMAPFVGQETFECTLAMDYIFELKMCFGLNWLSHFSGGATLSKFQASQRTLKRFQ